MKRFRNKTHKILISTPDAAGEGMDVADCNIIIEYDFLKTAVATTQIKGGFSLCFVYDRVLCYILYLRSLKLNTVI